MCRARGRSTGHRQRCCCLPGSAPVQLLSVGAAVRPAFALRSPYLLLGLPEIPGFLFLLLPEHLRPRDMFVIVRFVGLVKVLSSPCRQPPRQVGMTLGKVKHMGGSSTSSGIGEVRNVDCRNPCDSVPTSDPKGLRSRPCLFICRDLASVFPATLANVILKAVKGREHKQTFMLYLNRNNPNNGYFRSTYSRSVVMQGMLRKRRQFSRGCRGPSPMWSHSIHSWLTCISPCSHKP